MIPIIYGWGKKSKHLADMGIDKCNNCNNYAPFEVRELSNNASLFFVPMAKWNKKSYLVCTTCNAGYELNEETKNKFLADSVKLPSNSICVEIWNKIDEFLAQRIKQGTNADGWVNDVILEFESIYGKTNLVFVLSRYTQFLQDTAKERQKTTK